MKQKEMTIQQASLLTGYAENTLQKACRDGEIKARRAGKRWIVETDSAMEFGHISPHERKSPAKPENIMEELDLHHDPEDTEQVAVSDIIREAEQLPTDDIEGIQTPLEEKMNTIGELVDFIESKL